MCSFNWGYTLFYFKGETNIIDYQKLYAKLFNGITDTIEQLKELHIQTEEDYLQMGDEEGHKLVKFNVIKGKTDVPMLSVDNKEWTQGNSSTVRLHSTPVPL